MKRYNTSALLAGVIAVSALACGDGPSFPPVRDVRPTTLERGDTMVVELDPSLKELDATLPTRVRLEGELEVIGGATSSTALTLNARVSGSHRVLVDIDDYLSRAVGGRARLTGSVEVLQLSNEGRMAAEAEARKQAREQGTLPAALLPPIINKAFASVAHSTDRRYELNLFPGTTRKLAEDSVVASEDREFLTWTGLQVQLVPDGTGLQVVGSVDGFAGLPFLTQYDCGQWDGNACTGGPDGKVHAAEAAAHGYDVKGGVFAAVDANHDDIITSAEAEQGKREPSPAHIAGIRAGDVITSVDGATIGSVGSLRKAWTTGEGPTVQLQVQRASGVSIVRAARHGGPAHSGGAFMYIAMLLLGGIFIVALVPMLGGIVVVWERKISGRMQSRPGPNRVGPNGWLQWLADGLKLIFKEDLTPDDSDPVLFRLSPLLVFSGVFLTFVVLPFTPLLQPADLNIGVLYLLSVTSFVVVGVIMGGWASNSKWSLLGGMRAAAQIVSYELPASVAVLAVVVMVGSLSTQDIVRAQGGMPWEWFVFQNPFTFVCFFIFFISALAEGNRTPFDLPEAESELVSGYNTEYSGFRFAIFALAEWVNLIVMGAVVATIFLGGWNIPYVSPEQIEGSGLFGLLHIASFLLFALKVAAIIFVCVWIRWTLPRFRIDHMMTMCWKYFLPISLVCLLCAALWVWLVPELGQLIVSLLVFATGGVGVGAFFISRVMYARRTTEVWGLRGA